MFKPIQTARISAPASIAKHRSIKALVVVCLIAGCASTDTTQPNAQVQLPQKNKWSRSFEELGDLDADWWKLFGDPYMDTLIAQALEANPNLQVAAARSGLARAQIGQARASLLPIFNAGGRIDVSDISGDFDLGSSKKIGVGGDLLWELDVWGEARQRVAAQQSGYQASEAEYRAAYLSLVASVADTYFLIRQSDAQIEQQRQGLRRVEETYAIFRDMQRLGLATEQQARFWRAEKDKLELILERLAVGRAQSVNSLAVQLGQIPGEFDIAPTLDLEQPYPVEVPLGLPSELLARRPDLVAASWRLQQAVQLESSSRLARLPTVGITGIGGSASFGFSDLLKTFTTGLSGVVQFPVFDPNVRARIPVSAAQVDLAEAQYRVAVFRAFEEVENTLISLEQRRSEEQKLGSIMRDRAFAAEQQNEKLKLGLISQLELLEFERALLAAQQEVLANQWQILSDTVLLFKALGGGWPAQFEAN